MAPAWWSEAGTVGTWALAIIALWGDWLKARLFPPILSVELLNKHGADLIETQFADRSKAMSRYYHLKVTNKRKLSPAVKVQVVISSISKPGPNGTPQIALQEPLPLRWRHQEFQPLLLTVGHEERHADVLFVNDRKQLILLPLFATNNLQSVYVGKTELWIAARAEGENCASKPFVIHVAWDGEWNPGEAEMAKHLQIDLTHDTSAT